MDSGRRIHVPVLKCRIPFSICKELGEFLLSWQVGQAKNHPRRSRHYKAFQGIFPITQKSSQKSTTTCGLASARCVFNGSLSIFCCADEVQTRNRWWHIPTGFLRVWSCGLPQKTLLVRSLQLQSTWSTCVLGRRTTGSNYLSLRHSAARYCNPQPASQLADRPAVTSQPYAFICAFSLLGTRTAR